MGLDTTHDCWSGSYSNFHLFRVELAKAAGIELEKMNGFIEDDSIGKLWETLVPDHIHILLNHSDCGGKIMVKDQICLADRIDELIPKLDSYWGKRAKQFSKGLREANALDEDVEFQ